MESLPEIRNLLDVVKKELPELTSSIDSKTLDNVDKYFSKLEKDLKMQKEKLQTADLHKIEYEIPKHSLINDCMPYIQMEPELYRNINRIKNTKIQK